MGSTSRFGRLHDAFGQLLSCARVWHIEAQGAVLDLKYHAGASSVIERKDVRLTVGTPPFVKTNVMVPLMPAGRQLLAFMPDRLLVFDSQTVGAISYETLDLRCEESRFIEDGSVPSDATVVGRTWKYVNKSGGPDRRFKDNREIPICAYEEIHLSSKTGLNELIQVSRRAAGAPLSTALTGLQHVGSRINRTPSSKSTPGDPASERTAYSRDPEPEAEPQRDSWEGGFWEARDPRDLELRFEIEYTDGGGSKTHRTVRMRSFDNDLYGGVLIGHCELRDATRTFRFDRISRAVDLTTGEAVDEVKRYVNQMYQKSPQRARDSLREEQGDLLRVLLYVARADGQFRQAEKIVVRRYLRELSGDPRVTDAMVDQLFGNMDTPTLTGFKRAVGRVLKDQVADPESLKIACREIVATQKSVSPQEQEALDYLERRIGADAGQDISE
jgi:hypothetical protein